jgi:hypothetical protein
MRHVSSGSRPGSRGELAVLDPGSRKPPAPPRNAYRGPRYFNTDLSLFKNIPLGRAGTTVQLGATLIF